MEKLQLKLEELGIQPEVIDEVIGSFKDSGRNDPALIDRDDVLILARERETDWRKKAIISAEIIKRGLE